MPLREILVRSMYSASSCFPRGGGGRTLCFPFLVVGKGRKSLDSGVHQFHAGRKVGARYPVTCYQDFQPEFPKTHIDLGTELGTL